MTIHPYEPELMHSDAKTTHDRASTPASPRSGAAGLLLGLALCAVLGGPQPAHAQDETIWDMEPSEEVTAIHEDDTEGDEVGYAYVFYDEFFAWRPGLGPRLPRPPAAPDPEPCTRDTQRYQDAMEDYMDAVSALSEALRSGGVMHEFWGVLNGLPATRTEFVPRTSPDWEEAIEGLQDHVAHTARVLENAAEAMGAACAG